MTRELPDYEALMREAVAATWGLRSAQSTAQESRGIYDAGTRGSVTGGKHLGPLEELVFGVLRDAGLPESCIYTKAKRLPGYFRELKNWDVVAIKEGSLIAVVELKSQSGSFGNNLNNRIEEAIGQTVDFWKAVEKDLIPGVRPWFGYLMVVEETGDSTSPVATQKSMFSPDSAFTGLSYVERYAKAFDRIHKERLLDAVCFASSPKNTDIVNYPIDGFSFRNFAIALHNRVREFEGRF